MSNVIIVGGGAAGLSAAIAAAMCGDHVTVLERMDRVGKKILATGNGRCNLMNTGNLRFPGGSRLAREVLQRLDAQEQIRFWEHLGLRTRQEDGGRVYPISGAASTVLDTLRQALLSLGVEEVTGTPVTSLSRARNGWLVTAGESRYKAERVIIAGGGCAQPKLGSDGSTWKLLTDLGHTMIKPRPALTQIVTDTEPIRGLNGVRIRTMLRITHGRDEVHRESGELLFADYGLTGVCTMQCARFVSTGDVIHIDLVRALGFEDTCALSSELQRRCSLWGDLVIRDLLTGLCLPKLSTALFRAAGIECTHERRIKELTKRELDRLTHLCSDFSVTVKGVKGFDNAQVTAGGIASDEFDPVTLESRIIRGLHAAGEVLDVDGDCGGFNLMFAFGSGILAGLNGRACPW